MQQQSHNEQQRIQTAHQSAQRTIYDLTADDSNNDDDDDSVIWINSSPSGVDNNTHSFISQIPTSGNQLIRLNEQPTGLMAPIHADDDNEPPQQQQPTQTAQTVLSQQKLQQSIQLLDTRQLPATPQPQQQQLQDTSPANRLKRKRIPSQTAQRPNNTCKNNEYQQKRPAIKHTVSESELTPKKPCRIQIEREIDEMQQQSHNEQQRIQTAHQSAQRTIYDLTADDSNNDDDDDSVIWINSSPSGVDNNTHSFISQIPTSGNQLIRLNEQPTGLMAPIHADDDNEPPQQQQPTQTAQTVLSQQKLQQSIQLLDTRQLPATPQPQQQQLQDTSPANRLKRKRIPSQTAQRPNNTCKNNEYQQKRPAIKHTVSESELTPKKPCRIQIEREIDEMQQQSHNEQQRIQTAHQSAQRTIYDLTADDSNNDDDDDSVIWINSSPSGVDNNTHSFISQIPTSGNQLIRLNEQPTGLMAPIHADDDNEPPQQQQPTQTAQTVLSQQKLQQSIQLLDTRQLPATPQPQQQQLQDTSPANRLKRKRIPSQTAQRPNNTCKNNEYQQKRPAIKHTVSESELTPKKPCRIQIEREIDEMQQQSHNEQQRIQTAHQSAQRTIYDLTADDSNNDDDDDSVIWINSSPSGVDNNTHSFISQIPTSGNQLIRLNEQPTGLMAPIHADDDNEPPQQQQPTQTAQTVLSQQKLQQSIQLLDTRQLPATPQPQQQQLQDTSPANRLKRKRIPSQTAQRPNNTCKNNEYQQKRPAIKHTVSESELTPKKPCSDYSSANGTMWTPLMLILPRQREAECNNNGMPISQRAYLSTTLVANG
ncbi:heat shock protein DDB_G0288861-like [Drosophila novamexicana]|uniref:heat shock protein DDB_G0288861-like n=1 Tax=Drosophila novamexicana TaxID=47314 RepID=UPI0011E5EDC1|nr:heat shock protein DDB_G0288861-like [Drosophila novamexicana]